MSQIGRFTFVLHSHLPYVLQHGKWPHGMDWLNEAASETYIPILNALNELIAEGYNPKLSIGITPVLTEQLADSFFKEEFRSFLQSKIDAAQKDQIYFSKNGEKSMFNLAVFWEKYYSSIKFDFEKTYNQDLVAAFKKLSDDGYLDIITCGATHGYFPLLSQDVSIQAQIKTAVDSHERHYGKKPSGIWLPECAYRPSYRWKPPVENDAVKGEYNRKGIEEFLSENGIKYFFVDSSLTMGGKAQGVYIDRFDGLKMLWNQYKSQYTERPIDFEKSPYEIYLVESTGRPEKKPVAIFTRDPETSLQVWSGEHGYPGDGVYLDFHKKHFMSGLRYWRVTGAKIDLAEKKEYDPAVTDRQIELHAHHFTTLIYDTLNKYYKDTKRNGIVVAPFDTELFGHWWFEGPRFLKQVLKNLLDSDGVKLTNAKEALEEMNPQHVISIPEGSWGEGGHHYIWLNKNTDWTWKHIYEDEVRMQTSVKRYINLNNKQLHDILKQAARELLLLQASDWQFLISTISAKEYAETRLTNHDKIFNKLLDFADKFAAYGSISAEDWNYFEETSKQDCLFPSLDLNWWKQVDYPAL
jgi:1,4-alpha-glucan branching enzyme